MKPLLILSGIAIAFIIGGPVGCVMHSNQIVANMVKEGASPAEARCAMTAIPSKSVASTCLTAALLRSIEGNIK